MPCTAKVALIYWVNPTGFSGPQEPYSIERDLQA